MKEFMGVSLISLGFRALGIGLLLHPLKLYTALEAVMTSDLSGPWVCATCSTACKAVQMKFFRL